MKTSLLVSMYNKKSSTIEIIDKMFLPSLIRNGSRDKEIIIIDDSSPLKQETKATIQKSMPELKAKFGRVVFLRNDVNLGFGGSYNKAISLATGQNLIITNDDVYFPRGSINALISSLGKNEDIGAVGPITGWRAVCTYQYCKQGPKLTSYSSSNFKEIESFAKKIRKQMKEEPLKKTDILTGFCFAIKKEVIDKVGSFDERFGHGYLEDTDLIRRVRQDYDVMVDPKAYIHHGGIENASVSFKQRPFKAKKSYYVNCYKYARKWKDFRGVIKLWASSVYHFLGYGTISQLVEKRY
jgi:O-antigen biosynthesis protein